MEIQLNSREICKILKIIYFGEHLQTPVSVCRRPPCIFVKKETQSENCLRRFLAKESVENGQLPNSTDLKQKENLKKCWKTSYKGALFLLKMKTFSRGIH